MKRRRSATLPLKDAGEATDRFLWVLHRHGCSKATIRSMVERALKKCSTRPSPVPARAPREMPEAGHLLTVWHLEPRYLRNGKPKVLRRRGRAPSFESLARSVRTGWDTEKVLRYLLRSGAVRRQGMGYVPTRRSLVLLGFDAPATERNVRGLNAMLRTNQYNLTARNAARGLFERTTENFKFPVSQLEDFDAWLSVEGMRFLERMDARMRAAEVTARRGEPRILLGVGLYRYQQNKRKRST